MIKQISDGPAEDISNSKILRVDDDHFGTAPLSQSLELFTPYMPV